MKVIIPLAGKGTRLRPHTLLTPKPMLEVAGKPVMAYILDDLVQLGGIDQVIYITGHLKEKVEAFVTEHYAFPSVFVEQVVQDGTASAIALARPYVNAPVLIIFVDTIFEADLSVIQTTDADGVIWVKEVDDYQRFGVVVTDEHGNMTRIVEKPTEPVSRRANIGLYYVRNWKLLYEGIEHVLAGSPMKGEYYLTDAFQYMIEHGARIQVIDVDGWYDAGKLDTLLETNRVMLEKGRARRPPPAPGVRVFDPVYVEDGVVLEHATIGPNVSIGAGARIVDSSVRDALVGRRTRIAHSALHDSMLGDDVVVTGVRGAVTLGSHSEVVSGEG